MFATDEYTVADSFSHLKERIRVETARCSTIDYTEFTHPRYKAGAFHRDVASKLDQFLLDCYARKSPRLMLFAPPRHGKTELATRRLAARALGMYPEESIIGTSYGATLAERNLRDVKRIIADPRGHAVYPHLQLAKRGRTLNPDEKVSQKDFFELNDFPGSYKAAGVGGGITGMGATLYGVIDDPVKGAKEANSEATRDSTWEWYLSDFYTRIEAGAGILLMMTRWNVDDLAGRLLSEMAAGGEQWQVIRYPAIAEEDEAFRKAGDPLDPGRYALKDLLRIQRAVGSYVWEALYQQNPMVRGGTVFLADWWRYYRMLPRIVWRAIFVDTAQKTKESNDWTVFQCWGMGEDGRIYLLDQVRERMEAPELKRRARAFWNKWSEPGINLEVTRYMAIEDKVSGTGLIQQLRAEGGIPVIDVQRHLDKLVRAEDTSPWIESGHVYLPDPDFIQLPWMNDYLMEFQAFTRDDSHNFDDQIDATMDAISMMLAGGQTLYENAIRGID